MCRENEGRRIWQYPKDVCRLATATPTVGMHLGRQQLLCAIMRGMSTNLSVPNYNSFDFFDHMFDRLSYLKNLYNHSQI